MNKFFAALMTLIILVTVVVVFALGVLSVTGGVGETAWVDLVHDRVLPPLTITPVSAYIVVRGHGLSPGLGGQVVGRVRSWGAR